MAASKPIVWSRVRGRDGWSRSPLDVRPDMAAEAVNISLYSGGLGSKRGGSTQLSPSATYYSLFEYVPGQDLTAAELFAIDGSTPAKILRGNTGTNATTFTFTDLTRMDDVGLTYEASAVTLNGKLYLAYDSTVNRLHVFDPGYSTTAVRRAGMGTPAAPTGADDGAGALSLSRSYKVAYTEQRGGVTVRRSELSPVLTRTIVTKAGSTITKPAAISEGETHWELYSSDTATGTYYLLATTAVATTTYDDTAATIPTTTASDVVGQNTPFPSVKYLGTTGARLYGLGVYESSAGDSLAPKNGRFYFGPVLDSSSVHDDERINNSTSLKGWIDVARNSGAADRGVTAKPVNNVIYAFQSSGVYSLYPTGSDTTPYRNVQVSSTVGAVNHRSIVVAIERAGGEAAYFLDPTLGPYVVGGSVGLKWCGKDVKDIWDTFNAAATIPAFGVWYPGHNQVCFWIATGTNTTPNKVLVLDVTEQYLDDDGDLRGGWTIFDGTYAAGLSAVVFSDTAAATRSLRRVPYVGLSAGILVRHDGTKTDDAGLAFRAYVTSGVLAASTNNLQVIQPYLRASAATGVTIQAAMVRNFGDETNRTDTVSLTPTGSQTGILKKFEALGVQDADAIQVTLGDATAVASAFRLDMFTMDPIVEGPK